MCCLFGLLDYNKAFSAKDKNLILSVLSTECEVRGTDATGIAYNANNSLCIYKRPLPAHRLHFAVPSSARYVMGHTRLTTQGSEKKNYNNHPFVGSVSSGKFALCHNGILHNDVRLRKNESLPLTKIQTDSYVAVQLLEKQRTLNLDSLKDMAEKVEGSFTFTSLDDKDNLYIVKGDNPFCLYNFTEVGFYLYASTEEILIRTVMLLGIQEWQKEKILLSCGDILKIDRYGKTEQGSFNPVGLYNGWRYRYYSDYRRKSSPFQGTIEDFYIEELKSVASFHGYSSDDIDMLLSDGFTCAEIEEMLYTEVF